MSKQLWVAPVTEEDSPFCKQFDDVVRQRFGPGDRVFTKADIPYFQGVDNAWCSITVRRSAKKMVGMLEQHGKVRGWFR